MNDDFFPYDFKGKTIRIKRDHINRKNIFVIVDALSIVYSNNVEVFWEKIKKQALAKGVHSSKLFSTVSINNQPFDVADVQQMNQIIKYIPNSRKAKTSKLLNWLKNPIPLHLISKIQYPESPRDTGMT